MLTWYLGLQEAVGFKISVFNMLECLRHPWASKLFVTSWVRMRGLGLLDPLKPAVIIKGNKAQVINVCQGWGYSGKW